MNLPLPTRWRGKRCWYEEQGLIEVGIHVQVAVIRAAWSIGLAETVEDLNMRHTARRFCSEVPAPALAVEPYFQLSTPYPLHRSPCTLHSLPNPPTLYPKQPQTHNPSQCGSRCSRASLQRAPTPVSATPRSRLSYIYI